MQFHRFSHIPYLRFERLGDEHRHAVLTRQGGVSEAPFASLNLSAAVADTPGNIDANRVRGYGLLGRTESSLVHARLVHGAEVARVTHADHGKIVGPVDGLITDTPGCGLTMNFADCAPIFLYDPVRRAIGLGHAGWSGAVSDLPGAMVRAMIEAFGSKPAQLKAAIGPCIGPCCYEVGEPVISRVLDSFADGESLLPHQPNGPRPHFDLPAANYRNLKRAGVHQIEMSELCTACRTDLFYSHRAERGKTGRFGVIFILENPLPANGMPHAS